MAAFRTLMRLLGALLHRAAFGLIMLTAIGLTGATLAAASGLLPWLMLNISYGTEPVENAGMIAQITVTILALMLVFYLPANARVLRLENSHRKFEMGMRDIARAYHLAHAADRQGTFQMSSEFDSVRERLIYLRNHPDLGGLEPAVLEAAAQMSHISQELAETYSDDKVTRARSFLQQRQQEVESFNARITRAKSVATELKHWLHEVELEESVAASQLDRLRTELREVLPEAGTDSIAKSAHPAPRPSVEELDNLDPHIVGLPRAAE